MSARTGAVLAAITGLVGASVTYVGFVRTAAGQRLDARLAPSHGFALATRLLAGYDRNVVVAEFLLLVAVFAIGARRHQSLRGLLAAAMPLAVVAAANIAKLVLPRPAFASGASTHNSFPGGHVALAAATVMALCLVLPQIARAVVGLAGAVAVALVTVATIAAGWHRFSDGLGAIMIATSAAGLVVLASPAGPRSDHSDRSDRADSGTPFDVPV